ncbi:MAG TPA: PQQ-binding-like beta-propeller repeat protein [Abditibacteriaceae bacterium]|jgi:outer membrane protein assembly factor BamB
MKLSRKVKIGAGMLLSGTALLSVLPLHSQQATQMAASGWTNWRGPSQNGTSQETGLPDEIKPDGANKLWQYKLRGRGAPVIANGRLYAWGYEGDDADLQEVLVCLDAESGQKLWEKRFNDFISDTAYNRYTIGSPSVDPETGNIFLVSSAGELVCFKPDGGEVWRHSMMEEYGRLTFPNGRTGSPFVDGDLVITHNIVSNWGAQGPAADRLHAFDKRTGQLVWVSTPGTIPPKDQSYSTPTARWENGMRVLYVGTGDGHIVAVNAKTGQPLWRYKISAGGVNASPVVAADRVMAIQGDENVDSSTMGRMVAVKTGTVPAAGATDAVTLDTKSELWRNRLNAWSSSPVLVGNRLYQTVKTGELACVNIENGEIVWEMKLAPDQLHASPIYGDGKLYVPFQSGQFYVIKPEATEGKILSQAQFPGNMLGAPAAWSGKIYFFTTENLYCYGKKGQSTLQVAVNNEVRPVVGPITQLQAVPAEVVLRPGQNIQVKLRGLDANGNFVREVTGAKWARYIPPTARVKSEMEGDFNGDMLSVAPNAKISAGAFQATATVDGKELKAEMRGRVMPNLPLSEDFESFQLSETHATETDVKFAFPPLPWIGARSKWEVRDLEGNKVLAKTLDNIFFQRATAFIGTPDMKNYTLEADVMSDGNRRNVSNVGLINQRYNISLLGNAKKIQITSNEERIKFDKDFTFQPKVWYRLKTRVDVAPDGSGVVRAKAWKKGEAEPDVWNIEMPHKNAHQQGAPGLFSFALQSQFRTYHDNVVVTQK